MSHPGCASIFNFIISFESTFFQHGALKQKRCLSVYIVSTYEGVKMHDGTRRSI